MALVRILVDGYSLLHNWPKLAPGRARHSSAARDELIRRLTLYQDAVGTPVTIFFDGATVRSGRPTATPTSEVEVLYSRRGQTADQMIERAAHRFGPYGEVMAVTRRSFFASIRRISSAGNLPRPICTSVPTIPRHIL